MERAMIITTETLKLLGADVYAIERFEKAFPGGKAENTKMDIRRAIDAGLDVGWLAERLLTPLAGAEFEKVCDPPYAEFKKVRDAAWAEFEKVRDDALINHLSNDENIKEEYK